MVLFWLIVNIFIVIGMFVWSFVFKTEGFMLTIAIIFSQLAVLLILLNLNMYFIFFLIRNSKNRKVKLTLAKVSRKVMKLHIPIAISAASFIVLHIMFIVLNIPLEFSEPKIITGLIAAMAFLFTLFAGYMRSRKASGKRRKSHIFTAFIFFLIVLLHIFSKM